jgi:hypothetical protein
MKCIFLRAACWPVLLMSLLVLPCCKKSSSSGNGNTNGNSYYLKFKLNGTQLEFDSQPIAGISYSKTDSLYTCVIAAYKDVNAGLKNAVTITIFSNSAVTAGSSYNDPAKARRANGDITPQNTLFYYDSTANAFLTMGLFANSNGAVSLPGVVANARLTITELTASYLKGTFSGTVYRSGSLTQYYSITEGECYLRRTQ